jgi:hypothetical protein
MLSDYIKKDILMDGGFKTPARSGSKMGEVDGEAEQHNNNATETLSRRRYLRHIGAESRDVRCSCAKKRCYCVFRC